MKYQLFKVSQYLRGWINYFGIASGYQHCVELDHWIRRRVRMPIGDSGDSGESHALK